MLSSLGHKPQHIWLSSGKRLQASRSSQPRAFCGKVLRAFSLAKATDNTRPPRSLQPQDTLLPA